MDDSNYYILKKIQVLKPARVYVGLGFEAALLPLSYQDITARYGVQFDHRVDSLGDEASALFEGVKEIYGNRFGLVDRTESSNKGTIVILHEESKNLPRDLDIVLAMLNLKRGDLLWMHPAVEFQRYNQVE